MKNICFKSLITVVMLLCGVVSRAEYVNIDGLVYDISADTKTATVVHYKRIYEHAVNGFSEHGCECGEYSGEIVVPATVTHAGVVYRVTAIGDYAFYFCQNVTKIEIKNFFKSKIKNKKLKNRSVNFKT